MSEAAPPAIEPATQARLAAIAASHPYPLLFATVSGAHLYGFPSPDSDWDLRGVHLLPLRELVGLETGPETHTLAEDRDGLELDLVTHDAKKFFELMLKKNGYVLEQLHSPLVVHTTPAHAELREIARGCVTRHHVHHYRGFAANQWRLFSQEQPPRVKPLLYVFRVLLTGIWLMRTGEIEANLEALNAEFGLPYVDELITLKREGKEKATLDAADLSFFQDGFTRMAQALEAAHVASTLPEAPSAAPALHDLLVRLRLGELGR